MTDPHTGTVLSERAQFVRTVVFALEPQIDYSVARRTIIIGKYVSWATQVRGLPLTATLLFDSHVIDLYIRDSLREKKLSKSSVAAYRAVLLRASEIFLPRDDGFPARGVGATPTLSPYDAEEVASFPNWVHGQRTELMAQKATALMCLGLGCGLRAGEINRLTCRDVIDEGGALKVTVMNDRGSRTVPMLPRYRAAFCKLIASRAEDAFVFGQERRSINPNAISGFVAESGYNRLKVSTLRMRTTWIVGRLAAGVELPTLLEAAGLDRLEKLNEYLPYLPAPTEASRATLLSEVTK